MRIKNATKNTILTNNAIEARSLTQKALGLIVHKTPVTMVLKTRFGIHTFFMRYAIDVLVIDKNKQVVAIKKSLVPNRIFLWNLKYNCIIELPENTIGKTKTGISDYVTLE